MDADIRQIEVARLRTLQRQAAHFGPRTDPAVLIEIQELQHKYPHDRGGDRQMLIAVLDYDFLMNTVASALTRITELEKYHQLDMKQRRRRQLVMDLWMGAVVTITFLSLLLLVASK
jgi:hypothetical protein